jgi:hypothetical protein
MGLASLYNTPQDPVSLAEWSFSHAANHADIVRFILAQKGVQLTSFVLDPLDPTNPKIWVYQHQLMHNQMNQVLGVAGQDLTGLDWTDPEALSQWIDDNASEHLQVSSKLGIP